MASSDTISKMENIKKEAFVMKKMLCVILGLVMTISLFAEEQGRLKVTIEKFEKIKGDIKISLFNSAAGFPSDAGKAVTAASIKVNGSKVECVFEKLPYGEYAASVYYDENSNDKLDTGMFGIPKEAVGSSNNPKPRMGPPLYTESKFILNEKEKNVLIKIATVK